MTSHQASYPVSIRGELTEPPGRGWWLLKWLLVIPHAIVLFFLEIAFSFVAIFAFFAILITAKYPRGLFDFNTGVLRWAWRVNFYSYGVLGTDRYPQFSLDPDPDYPADLDIPYPERLSRGLVLIKWWLLAIPHYIIASLWSYVIPVLVLIAGVILLFTGKYNEDLFKIIMGMNRWVLRVQAYASLMRDEYPPFRLYEE